MVWEVGILVVKGSYHKHYLQKAYTFAWNESDDETTKTGALLVNSLGEELSFGTNHFPKGVTPLAEQLEDKIWKYKHIIHAEKAAVLAAAKNGIATEDSIMYMPWLPCQQCAITLIDAGVNYFIGHKQLIEQTPMRWKDSIRDALSLLQKAKVQTYMYSGKLDVEVLFNGDVLNL